MMEATKLTTKQMQVLEKLELRPLDAYGKKAQLKALETRGLAEKFLVINYGIRYRITAAGAELLGVSMDMVEYNYATYALNDMPKLRHNVLMVREFYGEWELTRQWFKRSFWDEEKVVDLHNQLAARVIRAEMKLGLI